MTPRTQRYDLYFRMNLRDSSVEKQLQAISPEHVATFSHACRFLLEPNYSEEKVDDFQTILYESGIGPKPGSTRRAANRTGIRPLNPQPLALWE